MATNKLLILCMINFSIYKNVECRIVWRRFDADWWCNFVSSQNSESASDPVEVVLFLYMNVHFLISLVWVINKLQFSYSQDPLHSKFCISKSFYFIKAGLFLTARKDWKRGRCRDLSLDRSTWSTDQGQWLVSGQTTSVSGEGRGQRHPGRTKCYTGPIGELRPFYLFYKMHKTFFVVVAVL